MNLVNELITKLEHHHTVQPKVNSPGKRRRKRCLNKVHTSEIKVNRDSKLKHSFVKSDKLPGLQIHVTRIHIQTNELNR